MVLERGGDDFWECLFVADDLMEDLEEDSPVTVAVTEEASEERPTQGALHCKGILLILHFQVGTCADADDGK